MAHFQYFPQTTFLNQSITNLAIGFKLNNMVKEGTLDLLNHVIDDHDKPDTIAHDYYDSSSYAWLVLLSNKILDPYFEWVMNTYTFEEFIKKKYGSLAAAKETTIHCEHKTKNLTVSANSLTVSNGVSASDYDAIDAYTYWDQINDNRRNIKLVNKAYLPDIDRVLKVSLNNR